MSPERTDLRAASDLSSAAAASFVELAVASAVTFTDCSTTTELDAAVDHDRSAAVTAEPRRVADQDRREAKPVVTVVQQHGESRGWGAWAGPA